MEKFLRRIFDTGENPGPGLYRCTNLSCHSVADGTVRINDAREQLPPCRGCDKGEKTKYRRC